VIDTLQAWDEALLLALNAHPLWLADVAWFSTSKWSAAPVVLLVLWRLFRFGIHRSVWIGLGAFLVTFAGTDAISSRLMKPGFERVRPSHNDRLVDDLVLHTGPEGSTYRGGRFGFVSSHASNTFGLATLAVLLFGGGRWRWLWLWAAFISWTRIYLGVHYPGDILFGALFGAGWAGACFTLFRRINPHIQSP